MPSTPSSAIVLGADGFLGRHMVRVLSGRGLDVFPVGRAAGDLSDAATVERLFAEAPKADRIFHLVTRQRTGKIQYSIQGELLAINARIHLNVLAAWRRHQPQAKLVSTGSSCVYPEKDTPIPEADFQSGPMHESVRGYGLAKQVLAVGSETYASQYGLEYLHCILATVYGPFDHKAPDRTHFMAGMIDRAVREKAEGRGEFTVWGEPETVRDLLYVDDQLDAILAADAAFANTRLNVSNNAPVTIDQCARAIREALDWDAEILYPSGTFRGTSYKTLDASQFLDRTGWTHRVSLPNGVQSILAAEYMSKNDGSSA